MKRLTLTFFVLVFGVTNIYTQTNVDRDLQWDFFKNVIPRNKTITISGSNWSIIINDRYGVTFSGEIDHNTSSNGGYNRHGNYNWESSGTGRTRFSGVGVISWENERMVIRLPINASGSINEGTVWYTETHPPRESQRSNNHWNGNTTLNEIFNLYAEYTNGVFSGRLRLDGKQLTLNMTGTNSRAVTLSVGGSSWITSRVVAKTESELNASKSDEFGVWEWNTDRTRIFLKSSNSDNMFVILNNTGNLSWCMEIPINASGSSESKAESGERVINLLMAFDGTAAQNYTFVLNAEASIDEKLMQLEHIVLNRFLGTMDRNASAILNQIKDNQMLILTYTVNNIQRTDMFLLDGLINILEYLK
jgi:hypothetical protein